MRHEHAATEISFIRLLTRSDEAGAWEVSAYRVDGSPLAHCTLEGRRLACEPLGALR